MLEDSITRLGWKEKQFLSDLKKRVVEENITMTPGRDEIAGAHNLKEFGTSVRPYAKPNTLKDTRTAPLLFSYFFKVLGLAYGHTDVPKCRQSRDNQTFFRSMGYQILEGKASSLPYKNL